MEHLSAIVEKEGKFYVSHCVEVSVSSQGSTIEEALANLKEAVVLYLKHAEPDELKRLQSQSTILATISIG